MGVKEVSFEAPKSLLVHSFDKWSNDCSHSELQTVYYVSTHCWHKSESLHVSTTEMKEKCHLYHYFTITTLMGYVLTDFYNITL